MQCIILFSCELKKIKNPHFPFSVFKSAVGIGVNPKPVNNLVLACIAMFILSASLQKHCLAVLTTA